MRGLPVNLASQPIEGRRLYRRILLASAAAVLLLTAGNVSLVAWLMDAPAVPQRRPEAVAAELAGWHEEVEGLEAHADPQRVRAIARAVTVANDLIAQRRFPWSSLFAALEEALPDDVRLELVQPAVTESGVRVGLTASSRSRESLLAFLGALERIPELEEVLPTRQQVGGDGEVRLNVLARHVGMGNDGTTR